jgi:hypothetical protein
MGSPSEWTLDLPKVTNFCVVTTSGTCILYWEMPVTHKTRQDIMTVKAGML